LRAKYALGKVARTTAGTNETATSPVKEKMTKKVTVPAATIVPQN
jgi:hypothetical protein